MSTNPHAQFDETVLDLIDHSPVGAVPNTPSHRDALDRLYASHQVYPNANHKDGHVTARSLAQLPVFHASNLAALIAGQIAPTALEPNAQIFDRYVAALPVALRAKAEGLRLLVAGRPAHHRKHGGVIAADPLHSLFLVPGTGLNVGLPGNYLYGSVLQLTVAADSGWAVHVHDSDDGVALCDAPTMAAAFEVLQEVLASAPFHLKELEALGFRLK
jgi:hypothetical protein